MDLLSIHDFVTSCICRLGRIGSLSYTGLPNVDPFHYIKKSRLLLSPLISSGKSYSVGKLKNSQ